MLSRSFKIKDKPTKIKKRQVPTSELTTELERLKKEKREKELRKKTITEIKNLKREDKFIYKFGKRLADNIKNEKKIQKRKKKVDGYLDRLGEFGKW